MASLLRQIVAGPRLQHPEAGLDLCYVTDFLIVTSGPSSTYPKRAYRNPTDALVRFLDKKHGDNWAIWEFRAEGTGYPDSEVYGRIHHFPWPDHHPPPFALIPSIMASMRNWLSETTPAAMGTSAQKEPPRNKKRVAVVHCKAGKGRSGTAACSYLISQEGWKLEDARQRFTDRRMRAGFGDGVSIASQVRWLGYVNRWTNYMDKIYVERPVEILEVHVWGLRDGVKIALEGYVDEGKKIKCFHLFKKRERTVVDDGNKDSPMYGKTAVKEEWERKSDKGAADSTSRPLPPTSAKLTVTSPHSPSISTPSTPSLASNNIGENNGISAAILRPNKPVILPTSDVNIDFERRIKAAYTGWAMVTSIAHVWFNAYFEGGDKHDSGIFECEWDGLDGIKGSASKGTKALERLKVVWRYPSKEQLEAQKKARSGEASEMFEQKVMTLPRPGEPVHESHAANWQGPNVVEEDASDMDFTTHRGIANPTDSPNRLEHDSRKKFSSSERHITRSPSSSSSEKDKALNYISHPFVSEASATTAAAVGSAVKKVRKELGLRKKTDASGDISLASSVEDLSQRRQQKHEEKEEEQEEEEERIGQEQLAESNQEGDSDMEGVKPCFTDQSSTEMHATQ